jgi:hypothetical protein
VKTECDKAIALVHRLHQDRRDIDDPLRRAFLAAIRKEA